MTEAERISDPVVFHGEGPFWDARGQRLLFVDMLAGAIMARDSAGEITRHPVPSAIAAVVRTRRGGGFVVALEHGFAFTDEGLGEFDVLPAFVNDDGIRLNEGGCDPDGRLYCGTMAYDEAPGRGTLYRMDLDHSVSEVFGGVTISNGLQWSADGRRAFYIDTPTGRIDRFEVDDEGRLAGRRPFAEVRGTPGHPDGMAIDREDGLWVALWGGSAVRHYDADGVLRDEITLPVSRVTACAFGGDDRRTLFITTSRLGLAKGAEPLAGSLFASETSVAGAPLRDYAG